MNQVTHAFRNRIANDPIYLKVFAPIINAINIFQGICWNLTWCAFLPCFKTAKGEQTSVEWREHTAYLPKIPHAKSYQLFVFFFCALKKLKHLQVIAEVAGVSDNFNNPTW